MTKQDENVETVKAELVVTEPVQALTPMHLIEKAMSQDTDLDKLAQLYDLQQRHEADQARKAFNKAFAAFKAEGVQVVKDTKVKFKKKDGTTTEYDHASLFEVCDKIILALSKYGLSHSWETAQEGNKIKVTCTLEHDDGHSKSVTLEADPDSSGGKNSIQAIGSAVSYLQRYTLLAITGLAVKGMDNDGAGPKEQPTVDVITEDQWANLDTLISQAGGKDHKAFCVWAKIKDLSLLPAADYDKSVKKIEGQIKSRKEAN